MLDSSAHLITDCVKAFCHHKDGPLTGQNTHENSFGSAMACRRKALCAMNADMAVKGPASRLAFAKGNQPEIALN